MGSLLIGLPVLIVLVTALADLGMGPDLVGGRLPIGCVALALVAQMIDAFRALEVGAVGAGLVNHLAQQLGVFQHGAGTQVVLIEGLAVVVGHEQRALQDLQDVVTTKNKKITLSNGKTYAATNYQINSVAISNGGSIAALADVIYDQFRLPIDYYVTVDMQALVDMVDNFGGIEVYIPHDMSYGGSKLLKGYRNLNGASAEFFVRCRHGDGYANSDIDRLNMQRYFYAGLFKRARAMGVTDILNQLPLVFKNYIKTDMDISTIAKLVVSFLKLDSSNIILAQTPVFMGVPNVGKTDTFAGYSCVVPDAGSIANLLNQYFCTYTGPIDVSEMHLVTDQWPHGTASTDANVQYMGRIDKESDDAILNGNTDLSGAVTTDGQAAGSAN